MIEPRPCDECNAEIELINSCYEVVINARTLEPEIQARLCPRCARAEFRRWRFGVIEEWARDTARSVLERLFGEDVRIIWLQGDEYRWALLCRRQHRQRSSSKGVSDRSSWTSTSSP